jgi:hypothetical protein
MGNVPSVPRFSSSPDFRHSVEEMQKTLLVERQRLDEQKQRLSEYRGVLEKMTAPATPKAKAANPTPDFLRSFLADDDEDVDISKLPYDVAKKRTDDLETRVQQRESLLKDAEAQVKAFSEGAARNNAPIIVTAAVSNAGDGATTLKPQALLRADLGQGNYLDISVKIDPRQYSDGKGEIKPRGTSILKFESEPLSSMTPSDRGRFESFFRNTSPTNLFVVDVKGGYHKSNTIPFAQGIYEQKIYDGLKAFASKHD